MGGERFDDRNIVSATCRSTSSLTTQEHTPRATGNRDSRHVNETIVGSRFDDTVLRFFGIQEREQVLFGHYLRYDRRLRFKWPNVRHQSIGFMNLTSICLRFP
jgi:hypothetical protein